MAVKVEDIIKEQFIKAIESGEKPAWQSPYVGADVAINRVTKHAYRGVNVFFLRGEYASAKQWMKLGYTPEKGKAKIAFYNARSVYQEKDKNGEPMVDQDGNPKMKTGWILRYYYVWERHDVRDKDGKVAPSVMPAKPVDNTPATEHEKNAVAVLQAYMKKNGIGYVEDGENMAYFSPFARLVHLPKDMVSENARVSTLAHECAHSTGSSHLLDRKDIYSFADNEAYSREELVAETASAIFCAEHNVSVNYENTTAYLAGWGKYLHDTPAKTILKAIYSAQKAARLMGGEDLASVKNPEGGKVEKANSNETGKEAVAVAA